MFPGREFDDLDEYRAAKKQRAARREEYRAQARDYRPHGYGYGARPRAAAEDVEAPSRRAEEPELITV